MVRRRPQPPAGARPQSRPPTRVPEWAEEPERNRSGATLTVSLHRENGPLTGRPYRLLHGLQEPHMRLIVALTATLTVLLLVLPIHP